MDIGPEFDIGPMDMDPSGFDVPDPGFEDFDPAPLDIPGEDAESFDTALPNWDQVPDAALPSDLDILPEEPVPLPIVELQPVEEPAELAPDVVSPDTMDPPVGVSVPSIEEPFPAEEELPNTIVSPESSPEEELLPPTYQIAPVDQVDSDPNFLVEIDTLPETVELADYSLSLEDLVSNPTYDSLPDQPPTNDDEDAKFSLSPIPETETLSETMELSGYPIVPDEVPAYQSDEVVLDQGSSSDDNIDLVRDEFKNTETDPGQVGIDENKAYEEIFGPESGVARMGETDISVDNLEADFEQPIDLDLNDGIAVDGLSTTEIIPETENPFDEIATASLELEGEASLPDSKPSFEADLETTQDNVLDLENEIPEEAVSVAEVSEEIDLVSESTLPQEDTEIAVVEISEEVGAEAPTTDNLDVEEIPIDKLDALEEGTDISSQEATPLDTVEETEETWMNPQSQAQSEVLTDEEQPSQVEQADQEIMLNEQTEIAEEQLALEEELASEEGTEKVQLEEEIAPAQELSKDVELTLEDLEPNAIYEKNGYTYQTDSLGRPELISGDLRLETGIRTPQQTEIGKLGEEDDQGGHMIATRFDGPPDAFNIVPQNANLNQGAWKAMENEWADSLKNGSEVNVEVQPIYDGNGIRPEAFGVSYTIGGIRTDKFFENISSKS